MSTEEQCTQRIGYSGHRETNSEDSGHGDRWAQRDSGHREALGTEEGTVEIVGKE